jgi:23S rRNA G2069 N7-methylase RlmK/C1962 C5-methylase RlmI
LEKGSPRTSGEDFVTLVRKAVRATQHGGRLVVTGNRGWLSEVQLEDQVGQACALEGRFAFKLAARGLPPDFPNVLDGSQPDPLHAVAVELS